MDQYGIINGISALVLILQLLLMLMCCSASTDGEYQLLLCTVLHSTHPQRHHPPPPRRHSLDGGDYSRTLDFPTDLHREHPLDREFRGPSQSISHSAVIVPFFVAEVPDPFEANHKLR